ncbi:MULTISPECIES: NAD(P)/FAD-dependent oxidoreductase [unclassified Arthrobacter]|uniref:flavin-containing monooxygenase n=1 Tax=unclassified Arthrobacter TaxID=235627 RepID=UPI001C84954D|nr:NAD(P)/FAD-dependent oxidoreductase [Arthrobacter sp. MAHUQ-56]MBX7446347.1 NAD(P)/FAD-dependent oxidoreductase [Arthrobacter sp. MAHUQ-56]
MASKPTNGDLYWTEEYPTITESDESLQAYVAGAEAPVLLAALATTLQDLSYVPAELSPPLPPLGTALLPHGGMSPEQVQRAQDLALTGMKRLRDERIRSVQQLSAEDASVILDWFTGGRAARDRSWMGQLKHEFAPAADRNGSAEWNYADYPDHRAVAPFTTLIVGAGISGIAAAYRLQEAGLPYRWIEASHRIGGTWWKNHYPGVRLDTPTYGYSFSFAQRVDWPNQFAAGAEVLDYLETLAEKADFTEAIELNTSLTCAVWDEDSATWRATTRSKDGHETTESYNAIITGVGQLDHPFIPTWPGQADFKGVQMHSQEWDHSVDLKGKKVAVIGTGASAYQIVPAIIGEVDKMYLFQRSAPWMLPAPTYHEAMSDAAQWLHQKVPAYGQLFRLFVTAGGIEGRMELAKAEEGWDGAPLSVSKANEEFRQAIIERMREQYEGRPDLLEKAIPNYPPSAKRMLRDNGVWAAALREPQTEVITEGLASFTKTGLVTDNGRELDVDVVIYATGFRPSDYLDPIKIVGRHGLEIHDYWGGDAKGFAGITVPNFPNLFMLLGPNTGGVVAGGLHFMIERAAEYAVEAIHQILDLDVRALDLKQDALDEHIAWVDAENEKMTWGQPYVKTWYKNKFNRVSQVWPFKTTEYWRITEQVNSNDYEFLK